MTGGVVRRDGLREAGFEQGEQIIDALGLVWEVCRDGGMAQRAKWQSPSGVESAGIAWLSKEHGPLRRLARVLDAVPDVPPTDPASPGADSASPLATARSLAAGTVERGGEPSPRPGDAALPVVPPDPPAVDVPEVLGWHRPLNAPEFAKFRDEQLKDPEVHAAYERARLRNEMAVVIHAARKPKCECGDFATKDEAIADALLSSGVLVAAADVRARALEDAADEMCATFRDDDPRQPWTWLRERANEVRADG